MSAAERTDGRRAADDSHGTPGWDSQALRERSDERRELDGNLGTVGPDAQASRASTDEQQGADRDANRNIVLRDVSKFYGDVLGVNRVDLVIEPGITSLVGPNGSGKSTLMNLLAGLLRPTGGEIRILGVSVDRPQDLFRTFGYCTQYDSFPRGVTGWQFVFSYLLLHGFSRGEAERLTAEILERVGLIEAAHRRVAGYSKGMRQRIKLAQAIAHRPQVMVLDEPLNGLDPMVRAETIELFRQLAREGQHVLISSHILHEVDLLSDRVILISNGYIVAEGEVPGMREEVAAVREQPMQVFVRCDRPQWLAGRAFALDHVTEVQLHDDGGGLHLRTRDADRFLRLVADLVVESDMEVEAIGPADSDLQAVYRYLVHEEEEPS